MARFFDPDALARPGILFNFASGVLFG